MRLVYTSSDPQEAKTLAGILKSDGIDTQIEVKTESDWGSDVYGDMVTTLWVIDEDRLDEAMRLIDRYKEDPHHERYAKFAPKMTPPAEEGVKPSAPRASVYKKPVPFNASPQGLTLFFIVLCSLLYAMTVVTAPQVTSLPSYLPATPIVMPKVQKDLLYDYPKAYEIVDKLVKLYGVDKLQDPSALPTEGQDLVKKFNETPYWQGFYQAALEKYHGIVKAQGPLFEKLRQGEFWRLFTPALLHTDILHILFNMLWLAVLGKQIEQRIGKWKYLLFILIAAFVTNTLQYLMGGVNFLGFSGIVCAMLTFICMRQRIAPWEGYPLERTTSIFLIVFIVVMGLIQALSFGLELSESVSISPGIANTAHLTGAVLGILLGAIPFFSWRNE